MLDKKNCIRSKKELTIFCIVLYDLFRTEILQRKIKKYLWGKRLKMGNQVVAVSTVA